MRYLLGAVLLLTMSFGQTPKKHTTTWTSQTITYVLPSTETRPPLTITVVLGLRDDGVVVWQPEPVTQRTAR